VSGMPAMKIEALQDNPEPDDTEAGYVVEYPEPTSGEVLASYRTYREIGGAPFEPYETELEEQLNAELSNGEPVVGDAQDQLARLITPQSYPEG
jgi:hypothetical protein